MLQVMGFRTGTYLLVPSCWTAFQFKGVTYRKTKKGWVLA